jgi:hypothetical protein
MSLFVLTGLKDSILHHESDKAGTLPMTHPIGAERGCGAVVG